MRNIKNTERNRNSNYLVVSACMMVKNEEMMLPRCLKSIKPLMDEIIIVDTGSTDKTVEIAQSFGAKVYFHPWENNFSKHRNQSISYATGDWMFFIDADEEVVNQNFSKNQLKKFLKRLPKNIHAGSVTMRDIKQNGEISHVFKVPKLFRSGVGFHYEGIVHNNPVIKGDVISLDMVIHHYGYDLDKDHMNRKFVRTSSLLLERIDENPGDIAAYYYLSNLYGFRKENKKTIEYGKKCLELLSCNKHLKVPAYDALYRIIGKAYFNQNDFDNALKWYRKGLEVLPEDPDLNFELSDLGTSIGDYHLVIEGGLNFLNAVSEFRKSPHLANGRILYSLDKKFETSVQYNVVTAYIGLRQMDKAEERWPYVQDAMLAKPAMLEEYLKNLAVTGFDEVLLERTLFCLRANPEGISLVNALVNQSLQAKNFHQTYRKLKQELEGSDIWVNLLVHIAILLMAEGHWQMAIDILEPYYEAGTKESEVLDKLAMAYDEFGFPDKAEQVYCIGMERGVNSDQFLRNALDIFKKRENISAVDSAIAALMDTYGSFKEMQDDILLFLAEYFVKTDQMENFASVSVSLFERNKIGVPKDLDGLEEIIDKYEKLSCVYQEGELDSFALQSLNIPWITTLKPYYLVRMGDVYLGNQQKEKALEFYQLALNKNYLAADLVANMSAVFESLGDQEGLAVCGLLSSRIASQAIELDNRESRVVSRQS